MVSPELLRRYPQFAGVGHETLRKLAMLAEERVIPAGTTLFREWEVANHLYLILKGAVSIRFAVGREEPRSVDAIEAGDLAVWSALVEPYRTTGSGVATQETRMLAFEASRLRELCREDPRLGYNLMTEVIKALTSRLDGIRVQLAVADPAAA